MAIEGIDTAVEAVIFDVGNVLLKHPHMGEYFSALEKNLGLSEGSIAKEDIMPLWREFSMGCVGENYVYRKVIENIRKRKGEKAAVGITGERFYDAWNKEIFTGVNPGMLAVAEEVKQNGFRTGILSNMNRPHLQHIKRQYPDVLEPFDRDNITFSCEAGRRKGDGLAIYHIAFTKSGASERKRCIFVDDVESYVRQASEYGMTAFHYNVPQFTFDQATIQFRMFLNEHGVIR